MHSKRVLFIIPKGRQYSDIEKLANKIDTHVDILNDEKSGYNALKKGGYDLVISSMFAGTLNGYDLVSRLKRDKINCGVILIMGDSKEKIKKELTERGVFSFVKKSQGETEIPKLIKSYFKELTTLEDATVRSLEKQLFSLQDKVFELEQVLLQKAEELMFLKVKSKEIAKENKKTKALLDEKKKYLINSERMISIGQMTASIVHEINNPLTVITSLGALISLESKDNEKLSKYNNMLSENLERLKKLTYGILSFSSPKRGEKVEDLNINAVIFDMMSFYEYEIKRRDVILNQDFAEDLPCMRIPVIKLQQVLLNILKNALFAVKKGTGVITIGTSTVDGYVLVKITDNGKGISEDKVENIFEPFFTTKKKKDGTGLGLYICKEILEMFNGDIKAESSVGEGTTVTFRLPAVNKKN